MSLNSRIFLASILGIVGGLLLLQLGTEAPLYQHSLYLCQLVGGIFIDLLKMVLVPLVFSSIVIGVANLGAHQQMHRVWLTTLAWSLSTLVLAMIVGLSTSHLFAVGKGLTLSSFQETMSHYQGNSLSLGEFFSKLSHSLFMNPVAAMAQNSILAIVSFALFVGAALAGAHDRYPTLHRLMNELFELSMQLVFWIMKLAPIGIFALLTKLIATESSALLGSLAQFMAVVIGTTLFHGLVVLPLLLYLSTRMTPWRFWRGARPALLTAFATSSSAATMPITMDCLEKELGVSRQITGFVVPLGAHLNMDGTALYEAAAALFIAHLTGLDLSLGQQIVVCLTTMLASIGAPGIPSAGMVTMVMVLQSVGLPAEAIAILLPIDRVLDTVRTMVNVEGDMIASLAIDKLTQTTHSSQQA